MNVRRTIFVLLRALIIDAVPKTIIPTCFSNQDANMQLRKIFTALLLSPMLVVAICSQSLAQGPVIYNNSNSQNQFVPISKIPPGNLKPPQEIMDWDSSGGGTVTHFEFGYFTSSPDSFAMTIRFYKGTNADTNGTLIRAFPFLSLPGFDPNEVERFIDHDISDSSFFLPPGPFGFSYEIMDSLAGPIFSTGEKGSDSLRSVSQNKNVSLPGASNQLHMVLRGLLTVDHTFEGPGVIQTGAVATYNFKIPAPLPPPPDPFINMEGFISIKTSDSINIRLPDPSPFGLTRIGPETLAEELERLKHKMLIDSLDACSGEDVRCFKIDFGNGFGPFNTLIFADGFESGDITSWNTGAAADSTTSTPKEKPVGVINEDKKLPVLTAEELAEAIELFNDDTVFNEKTIGLVSERFGILKPLPRVETVLFDDYSSLRKTTGAPVVTIDGSNCPAPCSGLILQGGNSGINGIAFTGFPNYGVVLESDSNTVTNSQFDNNGLGGMLIADSVNTVGGTKEDGNVFMNNGGPGIVVEAGVGNSILYNVFSGNAGPAIDLGADGATANDAGDGDTGPNNLQNFPELTNVQLRVEGRGPLVEGGLNSVSNSSFSLQFFTNESCDPSGNGEGEVLLGSTNVTTDGNGDAAFSITAIGSASIGQFVTATATDAAGNTSEFSACYEITTTVSVSSGIELPTEYALYENYPNPFNPTTTIKYELPEVSEVSLVIYNLQGKSVRTLVSASLPAGSYTVDWDGRNDKGMQMASGAYLLKMSAGSFIQTKKLMLMK